MVLSQLAASPGPGVARLIFFGSYGFYWHPSVKGIKPSLYTRKVDIYTALANRRGSSNTKLWAAIALPGSSVTKSVQEKERRGYRIRVSSYKQMSRKQDGTNTRGYVWWNQYLILHKARWNQYARICMMESISSYVWWKQYELICMMEPISRERWNRTMSWT